MIPKIVLIKSMANCPVFSCETNINNFLLNSKIQRRNIFESFDLK